MLENAKGYVNGNQQSIFDLITPTSNNGIYSYSNIKDTPISSTPGDVYARIIKMQEAMILVGNSDAYFTTSLANTWRKNWYFVIIKLFCFIKNGKLCVIFTQYISCGHT